MDITKMSVTELKALVYDRLALIERNQKEIQALNAEISNKLEKTNKPDRPVEISSTEDLKEK